MSQATPTALAWFRARLEKLEEERGKIAAEFAAIRTDMQVNDKWTQETLVRIENKLDDRPTKGDLERAIARLEEDMGERPTRPEMLAATKSKGPELELRGPLGFAARLRRVPPAHVILFALVVYAAVSTWLLLR